MITHQGGCHCGRVRFEVDAPAELSIDECNCSMCSRFGYQHLIVPANRFRLTKGQDALTTYTFNTGHREAPVLRHLRHEVVLRAALASGWLQRQCTLHRFADRHRHEDQPRSTAATGKSTTRPAAANSPRNDMGSFATTSGLTWTRSCARPRAPARTNSAPRARARAGAGVDARTRAGALAHAELGAATSRGARVLRAVVPDDGSRHHDLRRDGADRQHRRREREPGQADAASTRELAAIIDRARARKRASDPII